MKPLEHLLEYGSQTASNSATDLRTVVYESIYIQRNVSTTVFEGPESDSDLCFAIQPMEQGVLRCAMVAHHSAPSKYVSKSHHHAH